MTFLKDLELRKVNLIHDGEPDSFLYIFIKDEEVVKVTKKYTVSSKKKGDKTESKWEEVSPIEQEIE